MANTDKQALSTSKAHNRIILGSEITGGLGAGGEPEIGKKAAEASTDDIREIVKDANMVFIAAGMGGGTGTGAAPVIAKIAKDCGALVVAIVTRPFSFEGKKRIVNSINGLNNLRDNVDSIIVAQKPKLSPFIPEMKKRIAAALSLDEGRVNVKATTEEKLGFTGSEEGISSHAVCIMYRL